MITPTDTVVSEERLRECPFCGGEATVHNYPNVTSGRDWFVHCKPCDMSLDAFGTRDDAVARWNRRAPPAPSHTAVEPVAELVTLLTDRGRQESDGEVHLTNEERISLASTLTAQAAALVAADERVQALMAERTSLIATKREQLAAAESEVATLKARIAELEAWKADALEALNPLGEYATTIEGNYAMPLPDNLCPTPAFPLSMFRAARRLTHQEKNNG